LQQLSESCLHGTAEELQRLVSRFRLTA